MSATAASEAHAGGGRLRTIEELADEAGVSVRTVRFYTSRGLLPSPVMDGRRGLYTPAHAARLDLVRTLQDHGFTLAAIEEFLERVPPDASVRDLAVFRALLAPWLADRTERVDRADLEAVAGRDLDDAEVDALVDVGAIERDADGRFEASRGTVDFGLQLLDLPVPFELLVEAGRIVDRHTSDMARELSELLHDDLVGPYLRGEGGAGEGLPELLERLKPLTIQAVLTGFRRAVDRTIRDRFPGR